MDTAPLSRQAAWQQTEISLVSPEPQFTRQNPLASPPPGLYNRDMTSRRPGPTQRRSPNGMMALNSANSKIDVCGEVFE